VQSEAPAPVGQPMPDWKYSDFRFGRRLGKGRFGEVFFVEEIKTGRPFAIKVFRKEEFVRCQFQHQLLRELKIHVRLHHNHIIQAHGWFQDEEKLYLVLEYAAGGALIRVLQAKGRLPEALVVSYARQIGRALKHLQQQSVIHRDLKPENVLVGGDGRIKIADFGWASEGGSRRTTFCGTPEYLAPEVLQEGGYDSLVDVWCWGILVYELLVGKTPFAASTREDTYQRIHSLECVFPEFLSVNARDWISRVLVTAELRPSVEQCLRHPFLAE